MTSIQVGAIAAGANDFYGERVLIGSRRMPGDPMRDQQTIAGAVVHVDGDYVLQFVTDAFTWVLGDIVVGPDGQQGTVTQSDLSTNTVRCGWPGGYVPVVGHAITHYAAQAVFDAVWAEDCRNLRTMITVTKTLPRSMISQPHANVDQRGWLQRFTENDPILRTIITRPNVRSFHVAKEVQESFFAHQRNIRGLNPGAGIAQFFSTTQYLVPADQYALLPYCINEDNYWQSGVFSFLCSRGGGDWDVYFEWLSDRFDEETYLIDSGPRIRFGPGVPGSRGCDRNVAVGNQWFPQIIDVIPASRSADGKNRVLCSYSDGNENFNQAQFLVAATLLNGLTVRTDVSHASMLRNIVCKNAVTTSVKQAVADNSYIRLEIATIDSIQSALSGQVDLAMPWRAINIVSPDLLHEPERSQDANSQLPILSSYTLRAQFDPSVNDQGIIQGFTSTPHGDMQFSEGGLRRYHSLVKVPGGLRTFSLQANLSPKNPEDAIKRILLPPGGSFNAQILFLQKH